MHLVHCLVHQLSVARWQVTQQQTLPIEHEDGTVCLLVFVAIRAMSCSSYSCRQDPLTASRLELQVFALEGRGRVTSRVYSLAIDGPWDLQAFGSFESGTVEVSGAVWAMDSCWVSNVNQDDQ